MGRSLAHSPNHLPPKCVCDAAPHTSPSRGPPTLYELLGVSNDVGSDALRKAYLRLLMYTHPDKGGSQERFLQLQHAFKVLSDREQRLIYDERQQRACGSQEVGRQYGQHRTGQPLARRQPNGVTVIAHGQTEGSHMTSIVDSTDVVMHHACKSPEIEQLSTELEALVNGGVGGQRAASLLLARAELHRAQGRDHHARFDAEEALALCPDDQQILHFLESCKQRPLAAGTFSGYNSDDGSL